MKRRGFLGALAGVPLLPAAVAAASLEQEKPKFKAVEWAECPDCEATLRVYEGEEPFCNYCAHPSDMTGGRSVCFGGAHIALGTDPDQERAAAQRAAIDIGWKATPFDPSEMGANSVVVKGDKAYTTDENGKLTVTKLGD